MGAINGRNYTTKLGKSEPAPRHLLCVGGRGRRLASPFTRQRSHRSPGTKKRCTSISCRSGERGKYELFACDHIIITIAITIIITITTAIALHRHHYPVTLLRTLHSNSPTHSLAHLLSTHLFAHMPRHLLTLLLTYPPIHSHADSATRSPHALNLLRNNCELIFIWEQVSICSSLCVVSSQATVKIQATFRGYWQRVRLVLGDTLVLDYIGNAAAYFRYINFSF